MVLVKGSGQVLTVGSLSKLWSGGLRIGWLRAPSGAVDKIMRLKTTEDLGASILSQVVVHALMPHVDEAFCERRAYLRERTDLIDEGRLRHPPSSPMYGRAGA